MMIIVTNEEIVGVMVFLSLDSMYLWCKIDGRDGERLEPSSTRTPSSNIALFFGDASIVKVSMRISFLIVVVSLARE